MNAWIRLFFIIDNNLLNTYFVWYMLFSKRNHFPSNRLLSIVRNQNEKVIKWVIAGDWKEMELKIDFNRKSFVNIMWVFYGISFDWNRPKKKKNK